MATSNRLEPPVARADVVIVGGGPGGSSAAIRCAGAGLSVVLIEREPFPRDRAGETLHPGVEPLLGQLGVLERVLAANFLRHEGHWVERGGGREFERFGADERGAWRGFQAWRAEFDMILLERARSLGVTVLQPCRALKPLTKDGRVAGVMTPLGPLWSRFTVDAAGGAHWLARHAGLSIKNHSPSLFARYGYVSGECRKHDDAPSFIADERGWTWVARVRPRLYQWTRLCVRGPAPSRQRPTLPDDLRGLRPEGRARGADVTWRVVRPAAGAGYFLAGDAASVLDPASSHGVLKAMMSGMMIAHLIGLAAGGRADERGAAAEYDRWVGSWFEHDCRRLEELYASLYGRELPTAATRPT